MTAVESPWHPSTRPLWCLARIPLSTHECWPHTRGPYVAGRLWLDRCPCGAWRHWPLGRPVDCEPWRSRNTRAERCAPSPASIMRALRCLRRKDKP